MQTIKINLPDHQNIAVKSSLENFNKQLANEIVKYVLVNKKEKEEVDTITVQQDENGDLQLEVEYIQPNKIERLRRITGYLTTTLSRWNAAKQAEEHDRIKHL